MNDEARLHKLALEHGLKPEKCEHCDNLIGYRRTPDEHVICDECHEKLSTLEKQPPLAEDEMMCPRCKHPVKVKDADLTWSCEECGYNYKEFDKDLEVGADLEQPPDPEPTPVNFIRSYEEWANLIASEEDS